MSPCSQLQNAKSTVSRWFVSARCAVDQSAVNAKQEPLGRTASWAGRRQRKGSAMETETLAIAAQRRERKSRRKERGVFEKLPGSGIWWIRYADSMGRIRREKAGTKSSALTLYRKRKTESLQGKKLPENLRSPMVSFAELARETLAYSKAHKR